MAITTAGGMSHELLSQTMLAMLLFLFLLPSSTVIASSGDMLAFHLTPTNRTSSIDEYAAHILLGPAQSSQDVYLQPILYSPEFRDREAGVPKPIYVPSVELCLDYGVWNMFIEPDGQHKIIDTSVEYEITWLPDPTTQKVNLTLTGGQIGAKGRTIASMNLLFRCIWKLMF